MSGNITNSINARKFLIYYVGHGESRNQFYPYNTETAEPSDRDQGDNEGWHAPWYNGAYFNDLTNGEYLPFILSMACNTGWFDGEIDQEVMGSRFENVAAECFLEDITRIENGGAIAAVGSTRLCYAKTSGMLLNGIIQAMWPGYLTQKNQPMYQMGVALTFGKMNVLSQRGYADGEFEYSNTTFQEFHLFGDPETELWTSTPSSLTVSYPTQMSTSGPQKFVVSVYNKTEPMYFAKVCIQGEDVYEVGYTNSEGQVLFDITTSSAVPINVTVTKHNFIPHIGMIEVRDCHAVLELSTYEAAPGEIVTFTVREFEGSDDIRVFFNETELLPAFEDLGSKVYEIPEGKDGYAYIKANDTDEVAIVLFKRVSHPGGDPYIYSQQDGNTWHLADGRYTYDNPCIKIYEVDKDNQETYVDSNELVYDRNYKVRIQIYNNLDVICEDVEVTLSWAMFSVSNDWHLITTLGPVEVDVQESSSTEIAEVAIEWSPGFVGHICLSAKISYLYDENEGNNVGQENTDVGISDSPAESWFLVSNQKNGTYYPYLEVRQQGDYLDVWEAQIRHYSYQALDQGSEENISLWINPPSDINESEWRFFTVCLYLDGEYIGGLSINVTKHVTETTATLGPFEALLQWLPVIAGGVVLVVMAVVIIKRRKT